MQSLLAIKYAYPESGIRTRVLGPLSCYIPKLISLAEVSKEGALSDPIAA